VGYDPTQYRENLGVIAVPGEDYAVTVRRVNEELRDERRLRLLNKLLDKHFKTT